MKFLPSICYALFLYPLVGRFIFPILISNWVVNWTLFGIFSLLLPIAYVQAHVNQKQRWHVNEFLVLFCISIAMHTFSYNAFVVSNNLFNLVAEKRFSEAKLFEKTYVEDAQEGNKSAAKFIYWQSGVAVQYRLNSGEYAVYEPTPEDIQAYRKNADIESNKQALNSLIAEQSKLIMFFVLFQILAFVGVAQLSFYWLRRKSEK